MRRPTQFASGFVVHVACVVLFLCFYAGPRPAPAPSTVKSALVWTPRPGFHGGGGGGDGVKAAPALRKAIPRSVESFNLPHVPALLATLELPGPVAVLSAADALGTGTDVGSGKGEGLEGPGAGPRTGPGAGAGERPFLDGTPGVTSPQLILEKTPEYTPAAMAARIEGKLLLEATVLADGSVGTIRILRSLDGSFGLDQKAIDAVRQWRFRPGTYLGKPAAVTVLIELSFNLR